MKKMFSLFLAVIIIALSPVNAFAAAENRQPEYGITPNYSYTDLVSSYLSISSARTATCKSVVYGISGKTTKIEITQTLQKKNGTTWDDRATWSKTYNALNCTFTNSWSGVALGTYRVRTIAKVYSGSKYETIYSFSKEVKC